jgi:nicotinate-nucleotide pyrophosphorylase (carboxylating)
MAEGDVKVECKYPIPERENTFSDFVAFCHTGLGVPPARVLRDLHAWLEEDTGHGDETLTSGIWGAREATAVIVAKETFVLAGLAVAAEVFRQTSGGMVHLYSNFSDGEQVQKGDVVLAAKGSAAALLMAERTCLNFMCRVSGIATKTRRVADQLSQAGGNGKPTLLETRKTTPGHRMYEKYATRVGGAQNHRHGLDAGAMLKENHLRSIGNIREALRLLKKTVPILSRVEVEVTSLSEFRVALAEGADVIMLDNFPWQDVATAVSERNAANALTKLEVSGNLDGDKARELVNSGVDYASMGSLIHKAVWVDMSLQLYV